MSGLRVNFLKSMLVGVNVTESWLGEAASALCCKVGKIPFLYLGLPIGGDPRRLCFWEPMLARLKNRLYEWKSRFLSFGGRLFMLKSVLSSLPVYALSFFKAPADRDGLWYRVLAARYRVKRGRLRDGGRRGSTWWRELVRIREGSEFGGSWFGEHVSKRVGDGSDTFFWTDPWVEGIPLCMAVEETVVGGGDVEGVSVFLTLTLHVQSSDRWQWQPDPDEGYTVRGAYQLLTSHVSSTLDDADKLIWHTHVPLKLTFVFLVVGRQSRHITFSSPAQVELGRGVLLCSLFDSCVSGLCGQKEIIGYFEAQKAVPFICWTRSRSSLLGG
ncbi:hypothetical protein TSUD_295700 [Trifolium subterraneum]|uniref:Reverse transcriptase zinc-binding domain-containing protein n=1 Tax=Trifolium subterraneum TaxID=3900 RepID=A0A2Z6MSZ1_TRISU|nr:hypothetical protein TSUD_295700 [Trifolium subterraneum]